MSVSLGGAVSNQRFIVALAVLQCVIVLSVMYCSRDRMVTGAGSVGPWDTTGSVADSFADPSGVIRDAVEYQSTFEFIEEGHPDSADMFTWLLTIAVVLPPVVLTLISFLLSCLNRPGAMTVWRSQLGRGPVWLTPPFIIASMWFAMLVLIGIGMLNHVWRFASSPAFDTTVIYGSVSLSTVATAYLGGILFYAMAWLPMMDERERHKRHPNYLPVKSTGAGDAQPDLGIGSEIKRGEDQSSD